MTCHTWTTDVQKEWLESQKAAFIAAKQKGSTAMKEFYQEVFEKFQEKWPVAGTTELAAKIKHEKYDKVCLLFPPWQAWLTWLYIAREGMVS